MKEIYPIPTPKHILQMAGIYAAAAVFAGILFFVVAAAITYPWVAVTFFAGAISGGVAIRYGRRPSLSALRRFRDLHQHA